MNILAISNRKNEDRAKRKNRHEIEMSILKLYASGRYVHACEIDEMKSCFPKYNGSRRIIGQRISKNIKLPADPRLGRENNVLEINMKVGVFLAVRRFLEFSSASSTIVDPQ